MPSRKYPSLNTIQTLGEIAAQTPGISTSPRASASMFSNKNTS